MDDTLIRDHLTALGERDQDVARGVALVGFPPPRTRPHGLPALVGIVVAQQISKEAAASILARLEAAAPGLDPDRVIALGPEGLRACGLSRPKVAYVLGVAEAIRAGTVHPAHWPEMDDEAVIAEITSLKGFGRWSAEIYCLFALGRTDIFPADDLALIEALRRLKGLAERPKPAEARRMLEAWSPWRSAGSLFLWHYYRGAPA